MENQKNIIIATQQKIQQYIKNGSNGDLDLYNTPITSLPDNLTRVGGSLNLNNTKITSLPDNLTVNGYLDLRNTPITTLPDNLTVNGYLILSNTPITTLPDNLTVNGYLDLYNTSITKLPDNLTVGGWLDLGYTKITSLPDNLKVGGSLWLDNNKITTLPDNLKVGGSLWLDNNKITTLPDNLTVGGSLSLSDTKITSLPDNLTVNGYLNLRNTKITTIPQSVKIEGNIYGLKKEITNEVIKIQCECSLFSGGKSEKCCNVFFGCPLQGLKNIHYTNTPTFYWNTKNLRLSTKNDLSNNLQLMMTLNQRFKSYDEFKEFLQHNQNSHIIFYLNSSNNTIWWEDNAIKYIRYAIYEEKQNIEKSYEITQYKYIINNQIYPADISYHPKPFHEIYQVKRLSDGQLFTVGDRVKSEQYYNKSIVIESFVEDNGTLLFQSQDELLRSLDYFTIVTSSFPKWMLVSNDNIHWETRYVIADLGELFKGGGYQVMSQGYEKSYFSNLGGIMESFRFAKDITEEKITELTLDQIAEKFNIPISQLKIKK
ncbi:hypothetical protein M0P65_07615 [Candidatus Gracilibacteria bacterium]|jgi:hypothetical protein|nr:hypothetical protein [Candidatus Gracilibacteria bacterium]